MAVAVDLEDALADGLAALLPGPVQVERMERLTGGASRETWSFDAVDAEGARHALILRRDFPERAAEPDPLVRELDRASELELQRVLHAAGVPVPRPVGAPAGLEHCYVMERVEGESRPRRIVKEPPPGLAADVGRALAAIHAVDPATLPELPVSGVEDQLAFAERLLDAGPAPRPALELGLRWCRERAPAPTQQLRLVHSDFRNGNLIAGPDGLGAVVDWEYAHLGEPLEDLGFLCMRPWRFGRDELEVGGFGRRDELYSAYGDIDPEAVRFWEVLGNVKWGAVCVLRGMEHVARRKRSVELAAIGRRVAETEYDVLELID